jgi:hypothetical protein
MVNPSLKLPSLGITDINYLIIGGRVLVQIEVRTHTSTGLSFRVIVNTRTNLILLKLTYMALDNSFAPPFSMNRYFPVNI